MPDAPLPVYHSNRLIGCELELDSVGTDFRAPVLPPGWTEHSDASLNNGREYVLEPPVAYNNALPYVRSFSAAVERARTNMGKKGGFHVHVQAQEFNQARPAWLLARVYTHFQRVINQMLAPSRKDNRYCLPYTPHSLNDSNYIYAKFNLGTPARSRGEAKGSAQRFWTINYAMCRCQTPAHRSLEFRQGSPSGMVVNIFGWMTFVLVLAEMVVHEPAMVERVPHDYPLQSVDDLADLFDRYAETVNALHLGEWVKWRHAYMTARPTPEQIDRAVALLGRPHGIFFIGEKLGVHNKLAHDILEQAVRDGKAVKADATHYRSLYETSGVATDDLAELEGVFAAVSRPGAASLPLSDLFPAPAPPRPAAPPTVSVEEGIPVEPDPGTSPELPMTVNEEVFLRPENVRSTANEPNEPAEAPAPPRRAARAGSPGARRTRRQTPDVPQISEDENRSTWVMDGRRFHILSPAVLASLPHGHTVFGIDGKEYRMPLTPGERYGREALPVVGLPEDEFDLITNEGEPVSYQTNIGEEEEV